MKMQTRCSCGSGATFSKVVPENAPHYTHTLEGADDMPAHIKSVSIGSHLVIPVTHGKLALGTWQGIYLCEHRNQGGARNLVVTLHGNNPPWSLRYSRFISYSI